MPFLSFPELGSWVTDYARGGKVDSLQYVSEVKAGDPIIASSTSLTRNRPCIICVLAHTVRCQIILTAEKFRSDSILSWYATRKTLLWGLLMLLESMTDDRRSPTKSARRRAESTHPIGEDAAVADRRQLRQRRRPTFQRQRRSLAAGGRAGDPGWPWWPRKLHASDPKIDSATVLTHRSQ